MDLDLTGVPKEDRTEARHKEYDDIHKLLVLHRMAKSLFPSSISKLNGHDGRLQGLGIACASLDAHAGVKEATILQRFSLEAKLSGTRFFINVCFPSLWRRGRGRSFLGF